MPSHFQYVAAMRIIKRYAAMVMGMPVRIKSRAVTVSVLKTTIFCGALTGSIKPKQITYCKTIVIPTTLIS